MFRHYLLLIFSAVLSSAFAQDDALTITIPELPAGKSFNFSYEGQVSNPFSESNALNVTQQLFVDANGPIAAESELVITRLDNPPLLDLNGPEAGTGYSTAFAQPDGAVLLAAPDAQIEERAVGMAQSLVVTLSPTPDGPNEFLDADVSGTPGISKSYNPVTGNLTLSGADTIANYAQVLRTVSYDNTATTLDSSQRTATFMVYDDFSESAAVTTFSVQAGNSAVFDWSTY